MAAQQAPPSFFKRIMEAIIHRIEGNDDPTQKYDYLMDPPNIKTSAILSDSQVESVAESCYLGATFPSMQPLAQLSVELANWSPSKQGKAREQLTATMIGIETNVVPTVLQAPASSGGKKEKKEKQEENKQ